MTACKIQVEKVSLDFDGCTVISDLSLRTTEKRIAIIGRNGSGKSTLARLICGLIAPSEGCVTVDGIDVLNDRKMAVQTVGLLFQNPDHQIIFPTVLEEISFGLRQIGQPSETANHQAKSILNQFGCLDWSDRAIVSLSQGQRHLVCLLSILAMSPRLLVLDEPFSGLDLPTKSYLAGLLADLDQTILQITHDTNSIASYDRAIWLEQGCVQQDAPPAEVLPNFEVAMQKVYAL